jgi:predicted dehydrogenase
MSNSIVIIGTGSIAKQHTKNLQKQYQIHQFKGSETTADALQFFLDGNPITAVIICTFSSSHMKFVKVCIECNIPFYSEKPICLSSKDIKFLDEHNQTAISKSCVGFNLRYHPALIWLKEKVSKHPHPINFNIRVGHDVTLWRPDRLLSDIFSLNHIKGGGAVSELSHECDFACYLFNDVVAWQSYSIKDPWNEEVDAQTSIILKMKNSLGSINLDIVSPVFHRQIILSSLNLYLELDILQATVTGVIDDQKIEESFNYDRNDTLKESVTNFLDNLKQHSKIKPLNLYKDCRNSSKLIADIYENIVL